MYSITDAFFDNLHVVVRSRTGKQHIPCKVRRSCWLDFSNWEISHSVHIWRKSEDIFLQSPRYHTANCWFHHRLRQRFVFASHLFYRCTPWFK